MSDPTANAHSENIAVARAVRFGFAALVLGLSYPNMRCAFGLHHFAEVLRDMIGGKPLPAVTVFVLSAQPYLIGLSVVVPLLAIALVFLPRLVVSIYLSGVLVLLTFVQLYFTWHAVILPFTDIIKGMSASP